MDILTRFEEYLIATNKSQGTIKSYLSHLNQIIEIENIKDENTLKNKIGLINYNTRYSKKYDYLSEPAKRSYRATINNLFDYFYKDFDCGFISVKVKRNCEIVEEDYSVLLHKLDKSTRKYSNNQIRVEFAIKQVKKGCLVWTIGVAVRCVKSGLKMARLVSKIIKESKERNLNIWDYGEYGVVAARIATDLLDILFSSFDTSSILVDSVEVGMEVFDIIKNAIEQSRK